MVVWCGGIRLLKMVASSVIVTQSQIVKTAFTVLTLVYTPGPTTALFDIVLFIAYYFLTTYLEHFKVRETFFRVVILT